MKTKRVEFGGETYEVPAGKNPRSIADAQRMQRALRAAEKPAEAPKAKSATSTPKKSQRASSTPSRASDVAPAPVPKVETSRLPKRMSRMDDSRESAKGRSIARKAMDAIGASSKPAQENTRKVSTGSGTLSVSSKGGPARYERNTAQRESARNATDLALRIRQGKYERGEKTDRNSLAIAERLRRRNED